MNKAKREPSEQQQNLKSEEIEKLTTEEFNNLQMEKSQMNNTPDSLPKNQTNQEKPKQLTGKEWADKIAQMAVEALSIPENHGKTR